MIIPFNESPFLIHLLSSSHLFVKKLQEQDVGVLQIVVCSQMLLYRSLAANLNVSMATVPPIGKKSSKLMGNVVLHKQTHK